MKYEVKFVVKFRGSNATESTRSITVYSTFMFLKRRKAKSAMSIILAFASSINQLNGTVFYPNHFNLLKDQHRGMNFFHKYLEVFSKPHLIQSSSIVSLRNLC